MRKVFLGLIVAAALMPSAGEASSYAPLDCAKAATPTELTICKSYALGQDEAHMATLYGIAMSLVAMGQRADIREEQLDWLDVREACGATETCLAERYETRIKELDAIIDAIAERGPY